MLMELRRPPAASTHQCHASAVAIKGKRQMMGIYKIPDTGKLNFIPNAKLGLLYLV